MAIPELMASQAISSAILSLPMLRSGDGALGVRQCQGRIYIGDQVVHMLDADG